MEVAEENTFFSYLLGTIVNQYLSDIVSLNSFVKLQIKSATTSKLLASWKPTSGRKDVV